MESASRVTANSRRLSTSEQTPTSEQKRSSTRHPRIEAIPAVPDIPQRYRSQRASVQPTPTRVEASQPGASDRDTAGGRQGRPVHRASLPLTTPRSSTSRARLAVTAAPLSPRERRALKPDSKPVERALPTPPHTISKQSNTLHYIGTSPTKRRLSHDEATLQALTGAAAGDSNRATMAAHGDLFLQLADDDDADEHSPRVPVLQPRAATRSSWHNSRRSLGADTVLGTPDDRRPRTSGQNVAGNDRPSSRFSTRFSARYSTPRAGDNAPESSSPYHDPDDSANSRARRSTITNERARMTESRLGNRVKSPELPSFGRRRPSFGESTAQSQQHRQTVLTAARQETDGHSPGNSSEPKHSQMDSASVESQTAPSTVWDELDDLKSRIKRMELTGKMPTSSGAAIAASTAQGERERPRTATTAPTTVSSPPKQERKDSDAKPGAEEAKNSAVGSTNIHPMLHAALAKAKTLLNASLYRSLEATAADALQLAALTGSAGPQGTAYSAASIINGVTVSDRHIRRKADTMCRNLTDLCIALCEGKHEAPTVSTTASPVIALDSPKLRAASHSRSRASLGAPRDVASRANTSRPLSRLEARRSSILGVQPGRTPSSLHNSFDDVSASDAEPTPSHQGTTRTQSRFYSRAGSRLAAPRFRQDDLSGDDDPTVRPPSRAFTDIGSSSRLRPQYHSNVSPRESSTGVGDGTTRSPSLQENLAARRANTQAYEGNTNASTKNRVSSLSTTRRFGREASPPVVMEEEQEDSDGEEEERRSGARRESVPSLVLPRTRRVGLGAFSSRRAVELGAREG
ncbi:hypothetical protein B0A48_11577 [Cryoendolithus antarcticus]|uniref:LPXTG-motif cell wall anchor domain protein n=1 Tax=Cryoendolithus antarcticus TaxID=1507870 RepID=A0A1V8SW98_9PEZI|nr:hypothetical protein B0A48_11577 [Cryoendolithus antarcticus]